MKRRQLFLPALVWLYIAWSLLPVVIAVAFSFNGGRSRSVWQGFSLRWWFTDPYGAVFRDEAMQIGRAHV